MAGRHLVVAQPEHAASVARHDSASDAVVRRDELESGIEDPASTDQSLQKSIRRDEIGHPVVAGDEADFTVCPHRENVVVTDENRSSAV